MSPSTADAYVSAVLVHLQASSSCERHLVMNATWSGIAAGLCPHGGLQTEAETLSAAEVHRLHVCVALTPA